MSSIFVLAESTTNNITSKFVIPNSYYSFSHTHNSGSFRLLAIIIHTTSAYSVHPNAVTYNGVSITRDVNWATYSCGPMNQQVWYL